MGARRDDYVRWLQSSSNPIFKEHSPQPFSPAMSGSVDYHVVKKEVLSSPTSKGYLRAADSTQGPWRPWHAYSNMCWAQVPRGKQEAENFAQQPKSGVFPLTAPVDSRRQVKPGYLLHSVPQ